MLAAKEFQLLKKICFFANCVHLWLKMQIIPAVDESVSVYFDQTGSDYHGKWNLAEPIILNLSNLA